MITLYLIRHGETVMNKPGIIFGSTDVDLNEEGIKQAGALQESIDSIDLDVIISSPMKRCVQTASYLNFKKGLRIDILDEFKEMDFGAWEGLRYEEAARLYPNEWKQSMDDWKNTSPVMGESYMNFYDRVCQGVNKIMEHYPGKKVALITHGGCMRVIVSFLLGLNQGGFWNFYFEHGKYSLLEIEEDHCTVKKINYI